MNIFIFPKKDEDKEPIYQAIRDWHESLENDRGGRAQLRRAQDTTEAYYHRQAWKLVESVEKARQSSKEETAPLENWQKERLITAAAILCHFKGHQDFDSFGKQLAGKEGAPMLSRLRFRKLMRCQDHRELFTALRRLAPMLKGQTNLGRLAEDICNWGQTASGDMVRKTWAAHYYQNIQDKEKPK